MDCQFVADPYGIAAYSTGNYMCKTEQPDQKNLLLKNFLMVVVVMRMMTHHGQKFSVQRSIVIEEKMLGFRFFRRRVPTNSARANRVPVLPLQVWVGVRPGPPHVGRFLS
mmetsp:Transcript_30835/g.78003  ORF Transcript_30835/g.78003 Transcript_30835/m.78003 type:complete len:110 (-) Transcript_30835:33-362(-)